MSGEEVGELEASDIDRIVGRLLRELGDPEPPLSLDMVREALKLDLKFYSSSEHSAVEEITHRVKVGAKQLFLRPGLLVDAIRKAKLSALWMPDSKRIMIDDSIPKLKHRWIEGHEIGHSLIPWHKEMLFGDTEYTLDPVCHEIIEGEANYAAAQLLFMRGRFAKEARDLPLDFKSIKALSKRYGNTITTSLWRAVQEREPKSAVFGLVSCHPRHPEIGTGTDGEKIRYFIRSEGFLDRFSNISREYAFEAVAQSASWAKRGTIVDAVHVLTDVNGDRFNFKIESFCNGHALLTMGALTGHASGLLAVA